MRSWKSLILVVALVFVAVTWRVHAADSGPITLGSFNLDVSKSKYEPGPAPTSGTRTYSDAGNGLTTVTVQYAYADGHSANATATYAYDGKRYAVNGNRDYDQVAVKRTGSRTTRSDLIRDGKVIGHLTTALSKDGTTLMTTYDFTGQDGHPVHNRIVWRHQ